MTAQSRRPPRPGDKVIFCGQEWIVTGVDDSRIQLFGGSRGYPTVSLEGPWTY